MPSSERLYHCEDTACAISDVFRVKFFVAAWLHRQRLPSLTKKLVRLLIHTDDRTQRVVRTLVNIEHILHAGYEFGVFFRRDAPVLVSVGPDFVFFRTLAMASFPTGSSSTTLDLSASSLSVHLPYPSGAGPQANWMILDSALPSTLRLALSELTLRLMVRTASSPPDENVSMTLLTVVLLIPCLLAHCSYVYCVP